MAGAVCQIQGKMGQFVKYRVRWDSLSNTGSDGTACQRQGKMVTPDMHTTKWFYGPFLAATAAQEVTMSLIPFVRL